MLQFVFFNLHCCPPMCGLMAGKTRPREGKATHAWTNNRGSPLWSSVGHLVILRLPLTPDKSVTSCVKVPWARPKITLLDHEAANTLRPPQPQPTKHAWKFEEPRDLTQASTSLFVLQFFRIFSVALWPVRRDVNRLGVTSCMHQCLSLNFRFNILKIESESFLSWGYSNMVYFINKKLGLTKI